MSVKLGAPGLSETQIQGQIIKYLEYKRIFAWRNNTRVLRVGGRLMRFGARGSPDIMGVLPGGRFLGIEVKAPGETTSRDQTAFLSRLGNAGALVLVASCLEDVQAIIDHL